MIFKYKKEKFEYKKYAVIFFSITFGLSWGVSILYILFQNILKPIFGEITLENPLVVIALNSPSVAGIIVYFLYGRVQGVASFLKRMIPRKKDLIWFPVILGIIIVFYFCMHFGSILFGIGVPEITMTKRDMAIVILKNFYEETGLIGGAFGWYGFLLPYFQKKYNSSIKAGILTGLSFGLFVLPGYAFSSFETASIYPFYVLQLIVFSIFTAFVFNQTQGNVLFFLFAFWLAATGSKIQLYYFVLGVQIIQVFYFSAVVIVLYFILKKVNNGRDERLLQKFPDFIKCSVPVPVKD